MSDGSRGRGLLLWLLGAGFVLTLAMGYVASANFKVVEPDDLRNSDQVFSALEEGETRRMALRYVASELNRHFFALYARVHTVLFAGALAVFLVSRLQSRTILVGLVYCNLLSMLYLVWFLPVLVEKGRAIDFLSRDPVPPEVKAFYAVHGVNIVMELVKLGLLPVMALLVGRSRARSRAAC
jgi:hypothetical protein